MSSLPADLIIWGLLFIGIVFSGLGLMGLLLFPDTRSRMFTAFRATAIGLGAVVLAVVVYGYTQFTATGEDQYGALILRTLVLAGVLAAGTWVMYGTIRKSTPQERSAGAGRQPDTGPDRKDSN
jgi:multisubunit Na+/H+ antiporter MnhG subunit